MPLMELLVQVSLQVPELLPTRTNELVTGPDLESVTEAQILLRELLLVFEYSTPSQFMGNRDQRPVSWNRQEATSSLPEVQRVALHDFIDVEKAETVRG